MFYTMYTVQELVYIAINACICKAIVHSVSERESKE